MYPAFRRFNIKHRPHHCFCYCS